MSELLQASDDWYRKIAKLEEGCEVSAGPAKPQTDAHTLNACLAWVIGKEIDLCWNEQTKINEIPYCHYGSMEWNPLQNASQMEEVEAGVLKKHQHITYRLYDNKAYCRINNLAWHEGDDKKRAFALAVQAMEQSNNNNNKED